VPRGIAHPPELRTDVVAAVKAGASVSQVARRFSIDRTLVWRWTHASRGVATRAHEREAVPESLDDLTERIARYVREALEAIARLTRAQSLTSSASRSRQAHSRSGGNAAAGRGR
jgi:transposase-like protein